MPAISAKVLVGDKKWGTAWLAGETIAITAAHCLGAQKIGAAIDLEFNENVTNAEVIWVDLDLDFVALRLKSRVTAGLYDRLQLARLRNASSVDLTWRAFGFPFAHPEGLTISGFVSSTGGSQRGVAAIELLCHQGVGLEALSGTSGAAVCINDACIGIVVSGPPRLHQRVIFALPIEVISQVLLAANCLNADEATVFSNLADLQVDQYDRSLVSYLHAIKQATSRQPKSAVMSPRTPTSQQKPINESMVSLSFQTFSPGPSTDACFGAQLNYMNPASTCPTVDLQNAIGMSHESTEPNIFFFGDPGSGKSMLVRYIAFNSYFDPGSVGLKQPHIPMLVRLGNLSQCNGAVEDWLWDGMCRGHDLKPTAKPPSGYLETWSKRTKSPWLFLFDGFDEIPARRRANMLDDLGSILYDERFRCILTSRPPQGKSDRVWFLCNTCTCFELLPLTQQQEVDLATQWLGQRAIEFKDQLKAVRLNTSTKTPLLLTIALSVFEHSGQLADSRPDLYEALVRQSFEGAFAKGLEQEVSERIASMGRPLLEYIAFRMTENEQDPSQYPPVCQMFETYLKENLNLSSDEAVVQASNTLKAFGRASGIFICDDEYCYWSHNTIREFMAANYVARKFDKTKLLELMSNWDRNAWSEVILFLLALLKTRPVSQTELEALTDELAQHMLTLRKDNGEIALFLSAAWAEGAAITYPLSYQLVNYLRDSAELGSGKSECEEVFQDLASAGRSPIDLLGRLVHCSNSKTVLLDLMQNQSLKPWARESAAVACLGAGMHETLLDLTCGDMVDSKLCDFIRDRLSARSSTPSKSDCSF